MCIFEYWLSNLSMGLLPSALMTGLGVVLDQKDTG